MRPSFIGLIASGILILTALVLLVAMQGPVGKPHGVMIVLLLSIAVSGHSLLHSIEEIVYHFNPMMGKWMPDDMSARE